MADQPLKARPTISVADLTTMYGLTDMQVSQALGIALSTLRNWRNVGLGPPYKKTHGLVRYDGPEVLAWREDRELQKRQEIESRRRSSEAA